MTRDETINYLIDLQFVEKYTTKLIGHVDEDIIQDLWVQILEISDGKWELLWAQGDSAPIAFVSGLIYRNVKSYTSPVYYKYKKYKNFENTKTDQEWYNLAQELVSPPMSDWEK